MRQLKKNKKEVNDTKRQSNSCSRFDYL